VSINIYFFFTFYLFFFNIFLLYFILFLFIYLSCFIFILFLLYFILSFCILSFFLLLLFSFFLIVSSYFFLLKKRKTYKNVYKKIKKKWNESQLIWPVVLSLFVVSLYFEGLGKKEEMLGWLYHCCSRDSRSCRP